jgi:hypothetical protein
MAKEPSGTEKLVGGLIALVAVCGLIAWVLNGAGVIDLGSSLPHGGATATATAKPQPGKTQGPVRGKYAIKLRPGANLPGKPITDFTMDYLRDVAGVYGGDLVVSYGTAGTHVERSFHYSGHAADIGMGDNGSHNDSDVGDRIMRACLIVMGMDEAQATRIGKEGALIHQRVPARNGRPAMTVECIWKVKDHHDHVHVAAAPA